MEPKVAEAHEAGPLFDMQTGRQLHRLKLNIQSVWGRQLHRLKLNIQSVWGRGPKRHKTASPNATRHATDWPVAVDWVPSGLI
jgi:hypothetical protein